MTIALDSLGRLSDQDLLAHLQRAASNERDATAQLIAFLMELDVRRLYLAQGCSSLFTYCTQVLHLSEHAAYGRIEAARAGRRFPVILERLAEGSLNLTAIGLLAPHLTSANHLEVLEAASHKTKRQVEQLVARLHPRPDAPPAIRKLPEPKPVLLPHEEPVLEKAENKAPLLPARTMPRGQTRPAEVKPVAPERYRIQFTVGRETYERLRRIQDLMRHTIPDGDPALIFDRALTLLLGRAFQDQVRRRRSAAHGPSAGADVPIPPRGGEARRVAT